MSENTIFCPRCDSNKVVKNGFIHNGNQNFKCKQCGRQFVLNPKNKPIAQETKELIDNLLLEKLPRFWDCQSDWCVREMVTKLCQYLVCIGVKRGRSLAQKKGRLTIECDEIW